MINTFLKTLSYLFTLAGKICLVGSAVTIVYVCHALKPELFILAAIFCIALDLITHFTDRKASKPTPKNEPVSKS